VQDNKNIVLLITSGDSEWKYTGKKIDAITSASVSENEEQIYSKITQKIDQIITDKK